MQKKNSIIPKFMVENPNDVFTFLLPTTLHLDYEDFANCQFNVLVKNLTKKESFIEQMSPEIFFTHFAFRKVYQNGKLAPYQNSTIAEDSFKIDTTNLLYDDIQLKDLLDNHSIQNLTNWEKEYLYNVKNLHCVVIKQNDITIIIPQYAIATYYYFRSTAFREAAFRCKVDDLYLSCSYDHDSASIIVPNTIRSKDEAMLVHRFICQKYANKCFEDIGRYILNFLKFMKENHPEKHIEYMPIKAAFPVKSTFDIDVRVSSFYDKKIGDCLYVHEILNDNSPIGFTNFTFQTQISNIQTEVDEDLTSVPKEEPIETTETLISTPATRRYRQNTISTNRKKRCGSLIDVNLEIEEITDDEIKTKILKVYQTEDKETPTDQSLTESSQDGKGKPRKTLISPQGEELITPKTHTEFTHNFDEFNQYMNHMKNFKHIQNLQVNNIQQLDIVIDKTTNKPNKKSVIEGRGKQYITATFIYQNNYVGLLELEKGVLEILCQSDRIYSKGLNNESNT